MINIADRLKSASRPGERIAKDSTAEDSPRAKGDSSAPVPCYPAKNLVLENGQYRVADSDK